MSWVEWLKGLAERLPGADGEATAGVTRAPVRVRKPRKGGDAYAKEWVKVLEETGPDRDPANTYTWELHTDKTKPAARGVSTLTKPAKPAQPADPFDTYTWELQEGDSAEDPWGLNKAPPTENHSKKNGVNPYDTGVFDATWTGRFDQR
jgi:hypothetical protein